MVGAVVVREDGTIVGQGYHEKAGGPHAEVRALDEAGDLSRRASLFVTLEPCAHVGLTGPCVERVAAEALARAHHVHRQRPGQQRADLHRGGVGPHDDPGGGLPVAMCLRRGGRYNRGRRDTRRPRRGTPSSTLREKGRTMSSGNGVIVFKNAQIANDDFDSSAIIKQLYPEQESYKKEEQRRFEILEAHWDLPVKDYDLDKK